MSTMVVTRLGVKVITEGKKEIPSKAIEGTNQSLATLRNDRHRQHRKVGLRRRTIRELFYAVGALKTQFMAAWSTEEPYY